MRARYSAFAGHDEAYLLRTWHPDTRPKRVPFESGLRWLGLDVIATTGGNLLDAEGIVEFHARYERANTPGVLHERSRFVRSNGCWVYVVGDQT